MLRGLFILITALGVTAGDWPTLGGNNSRSPVDKTQGVPTEWDAESGENIKWSVKLGTTTYGNPVIADGKVLIGTNNGHPRDKEITKDKGILMCFSEKDGSFLWQAIHDKLPSGHVNDWPHQGVASTPAVDGKRAYYVSNRCELVCVDTEGFYDGKNDGFQGETYTGKEHADIIWKLDLMAELKVFPHNLANSSPLVEGDLVYLNTGNGVNEEHKLPSPNAPDFIAVNKKTGKLVWQASTSQPVFHGQWSSPALATIGGKKQVVFAGGDGQVYSYDAVKGSLIWQFDASPKEAKWLPGGDGTRNNLIATPVIHGDSVYIAGGQDPELGSGVGNLHRIDAKGTGDITASGSKWKLGGDDFSRTLCTVAIADGLLYVSDLDGFFHCVDIATGKTLWKHDLFATVWGGALAVDGKVYIGDEDGDLCILGQGRAKKEINEINLGSAIYTSPAIANGVLYVATNEKLFAIGK